jgi:hypothetical protein
MSKRGYKKRFVIYSFVLAVLVLVVFNVINYKSDYDNQPVADETRLIAPYLYNFYVSSNPDIKNRPYYGSEDASITMIAFLDIDSEISKNFIEGIFPRIKEDHIDNENLKYYHKNYITLEDIKEQNNNFRYSMALLCISKIKREKYYDFYFDIFNIDIKDIQKLLRKYKIPRNKYDDCTKEQENLDQLYRDALEIENLGMVGINQRFYIGISGRDNTVLSGIPKYDKFQNTIRQYEIQLGN